MTDNPLLVALSKLDALNDAHWTENGAPKIAAVQALLGADAPQLKREDITNAAPELTRESALEAAALAETEQKRLADEAEAAAASAAANKDPGEGDAPNPEDTDTNEEELSLKDELQALEDAIATKQAEINEGARQLQKLVDAKDEVLKEMEPGAQSHVTNQHNIMQYLASQHAQRLRRAGVQVGSTKVAGSQLDKAFAHKRARGTARPTIPVKKA